ncbi:FAD-dependent oxidoreductase [Legionella yabuuchiae]|uniref:FAD-dependent oxidoreductase n=1 Tax=Legionella yabuuchiae TaxID=376727 RepID=UPI0013EF8336|nr:FAD-dependent oxidoreductase [Legionella yabuuchiae]
MKDVFVIGAGVAGIGAALKLADKGHNVFLIEKETIGYGSSSRNPGRMGHGFHYVNPETAIMYLRASIQVQRQFPGYLIGQEKPFEHPLRHGRYFITKNSDNSPEEILSTYKLIKNEYQRLVIEDPRNEVFGPPEHFFRILSSEEYQDIVNPDIVEIGVETAEHLFSWQQFSKDIKIVLNSHPNITLLEHTKLHSLERGKFGEPRFILNTITKSGDSCTYKTDFVINSTWEHIEALNNQIGIRMLPDQRTNRLKCLLIVKLPKTLLDANSMFFCMGQHCMFSNLGNGFGMMTFAKVTNMEASSNLELSKNTKRLLENKATLEEKEKISQEMLAGVSQYIPEMKHAEIVDVKFGIVQTSGKLTLSDLMDPKSTFHKRDYDGIREEQVGLISNPCMKLFYFLHNAEIVSSLLEAQILATEWIQEVILSINTKANDEKLSLHNEINHSLLNYLSLYTSSSKFMNISPQKPSEFSQTFFKTMQNKKATLNEIKHLYDARPSNP